MLVVILIFVRYAIYAIYVDVIIHVSNNIEMLNTEKAALCKMFMVDNGVC